MTTLGRNEHWPELPYEAWRDTRDTLHMELQVIGKVRLALAPMEPQWSQVPLYVTDRGLTTSPMPVGVDTLEITVDFFDHRVRIDAGDGSRQELALESRPVADFYAELMDALASWGVHPEFLRQPSEVPDPIPFAEDRVHSTYDPDAAQQFWRVLSEVDVVMKEYRARFRGRTSPVHFFWGTFDHAVTRFSGRPAEPPPDADVIMRYGADAEQIGCGWWPGNGTFPDPAFYSLTYPKPDGIEGAALRPDAAGWNDDLGEFIFRYDDARAEPSPRAAILDFFDSAYEEGASRSGWDPELAKPVVVA